MKSFAGIFQHVIKSEGFTGFPEIEYMERIPAVASSHSTGSIIGRFGDSAASTQSACQIQRKPISKPVSAQQAVARAGAASIVALLYLPFEKIYFNRIFSTTPKSLAQLLHGCSYDGFTGLTTMSFVKAGSVFIFQSAIGGPTGYFVGGLSEGVFASADRVLKQKIHTYRAKGCIDVMRLVPPTEMASAFRWALALCPVQSGLFWLLFPILAAAGEKKLTSLLPAELNSEVKSCGGFMTDYLSALAVGGITYPIHHYTQYKIKEPLISFRQDLNSFQSLVKNEGYKGVIKKMYHGAPLALGFFALIKASVWTVVAGVDKSFVELDVSKRPAPKA